MTLSNRPILKSMKKVCYIFLRLNIGQYFLTTPLIITLKLDKSSGNYNIYNLFLNVGLVILVKKIIKQVFDCRIICKKIITIFYREFHIVSFNFSFFSQTFIEKGLFTLYVIVNVII